MSMRRVAATVQQALAQDGFAAEPERGGFIDLVHRTDRARQVVQLQCSPPGAFRARLRMPGMARPMLTANLLVDHVATATAFARPLGAWPAPVEQRLGMLVDGSDRWWLLGPPQPYDVGTCSTDPLELAGSLVDATRVHGLPFLDEVADPAVAHERGLAADRPEFAAELAWVAGDAVAARAAVAEVRAVLDRVQLTDPPSHGQQRLLDALARLEGVIGAT